MSSIGFAQIRKALVAGVGALITAGTTLQATGNFQWSSITQGQIFAGLFVALTAAVATFRVPNADGEPAAGTQFDAAFAQLQTDLAAPVDVPPATYGGHAA